MDKWFALTLGFILTVIILSVFNTVFAEDYTIEITDTGFNPTNATINHTDHLRFVSNSTSNWIIKSESLLGGQHVIDSQGTTWSGFNNGTFTVALHKNYGDNLGLTPLTIEIEYLEPEVVEPEPEVVEVTPTNTTTEVEETEVVEQEPLYCGFTGWKEEGDRNVAYRCGEEVASYIIDNPQDNFVGNTQTEHQQTLDLRLQILKVLENIFSIIFG
tara:strand:- start:345 stop:989 length:645 start_codon:yes stop_codon:yes gene_type:complete